jgi:hypothetical protein
MIIESGDNLQILPGIRLQTLDMSADFLQPIALTYFRSSENCRLVVGPTGLAAPLIDDIWEAQRSGRRIDSVPLVRLMSQLVDRNIGFICWCGSDSRDLPQVGSWEDLMAQLQAQTAAQPADLYIHYEPSRRDGSGGSLKHTR